jgi:hypothetical protein
MIAVVYEASTGVIAQMIEGAPQTVVGTAAAMRMAWLEVPDHQAYDSTHKVVDGALVPIEG